VKVVLYELLNAQYIPDIVDLLEKTGSNKYDLYMTETLLSATSDEDVSLRKLYQK
jgi:hypothetical protein